MSNSLCSWKLVKTSPLHGNAFLIKLPTSQEELQGKWQEYACFIIRRRGEVFDNGAFYKMMSVEYNYKKSFCIKYLLKFKNPTEVCQTIALIWTQKQFTEESWPQLFRRWMALSTGKITSSPWIARLQVSLTLICWTVNYLAQWIALSNFWTTGAW